MTVMDASVALTLVLPDEHADGLDELLETIARTGALAPTVWTFEVASGIAMARRRGRIDSGASDAALEVVSGFPMEFVHPRSADLVEMAGRTGLTVYDASYLTVCLAHGLPLATVDSGMRRAAVDLGIELL